jgi:hypothetical protein
MNQKSGNFILLEPSSPESLVPDSWVEPWMIAVAALVFVALLAIFLFRKKSLPALDPLAIRRAAYAEAVAALSGIQNGQARDTAIQSSLILRKFLSVAAGDPALFETHEETISRHEAFKAFSDDARQATTLGFSRLASLKYAADLPDVPANQVMAESRALLETLHHGFQA